ARHKININKSVDEYAGALGVDPSMVNSNDEAQAMADAEAQAQAQAQAMAQAEQSANVAKTASETSTAGDSVLNAAMQQAGAQ
ncbi:MAG: phage tail protein, partial [bacterium]|nr:phage tail protein [bacterium]